MEIKNFTDMILSLSLSVRSEEFLSQSYLVCFSIPCFLLPDIIQGIVDCTVVLNSGQFTKRIMIRFMLHLPFVLSYFFPSLIFLPSQSIFLGLFEHYIHNSLLHCRLNYNFLPPKTALSILKINPVSVPEDIKRIRG